MQKPKFKAGDKVKRVLGADNDAWRLNSGFVLGEELTVETISLDGRVSLVGKFGWWCGERFELLLQQPITTPNSDSLSKSPSDYLRQAADTLDERGKQYDASGSERSMDKTVAIFNMFTGNNLSTAEGWQFMKVLKDVRLWSNTDEVHADSIVDNLGYTALLAEETLSLGGKLKAKD